jgi:hypothetical protein
LKLTHLGQDVLLQLRLHDLADPLAVDDPKVDGAGPQLPGLDEVHRTLARTSPVRHVPSSLG